jgi:hypothetical protein
VVELVTKTDLAATKADLTLALDNAVLRLTVRLGSIIAAGIAVLGVVIAVLQRIH